MQRQGICENPMSVNETLVMVSNLTSIPMFWFGYRFKRVKQDNYGF